MDYYILLAKCSCHLEGYMLPESEDLKVNEKLIEKFQILL